MTSNEQASPIVTQASRNRDVVSLGQRLAPWLERKGIGPAGFRVANLRYPHGAGTSNETIIFDLISSVDTYKTYVLRPHPGDFQLFYEADFALQYSLLDVIGRNGSVPVPRVAGYEADPSVLGVPFYVMDFVAGRVPAAVPVYNRTGWLAEASAADRRRVWLSAMEALTCIHAMPAEDFRFVHRPRYGDTGFVDEFTYWQAACHWAVEGDAPPLVQAAREWLLSHPVMPPREGLSWGDARIGNMIFDDDFRVAAVIDWEQASFAGGLQDLAYWLFTDDAFSKGMGVPRLDGLGTRAETIALWQNATGQAAVDLEWLEIFAGFKLAVLALRKFRLDGTRLPGINAGNNPFTRMLAERLDLAPPEDAA